MDIRITTMDLNENYEIVQAIFAIDSHTGGFLSGVDPNKAFDGVKKQLKEKAESLGCNAIIGCQFEYRNALADGFMGKKQAIEIFAYGTAVRTS